ncbi:uncharacterized protein LOC125579098 [Brassica napus]|uniref:uncharacterized protein LOC125579098 n=1 Tax=Brassica napus TaxID=3708 RepID=UPI002078A386|nr:uncharacterized protein LOC125579098 [Brassica napus]
MPILKVLLNDIEAELEIVKRKQRTEVEDVDLWRGKAGHKPRFSTTETWMQIRETGVKYTWGGSIWFSQATPKFAFITWIAARGRLATMDRISRWNPGVDSTCVLCKVFQETTNHLFFECVYSSGIWEKLVKGILGNAYAYKWDEVTELISVSSRGKMKRFCLRYAFQITVYMLWRERNKRRHGESPMPQHVLVKMIDKAIRNKLSLVQMKGIKGMNFSLQYWFETRE